MGCVAPAVPSKLCWIPRHCWKNGVKPHCFCCFFCVVGNPPNWGKRPGYIDRYMCIHEVLYLNTYIALYFLTPKLPVKHTHNPKKIVSIPLTLVPSLANYTHPPSLGVSPSHTQTCHSSFWRHRERFSLCRRSYFCAFAFGHGVKVTGVYHASFY